MPMALPLRTLRLSAAAGALLLLAAPARADGTALGKPVRLGRPAPEPKVLGYNRASVVFSADGKRLAWVFGESTAEGERGFAKEGGLVIDVWDLTKRRLVR